MSRTLGSCALLICSFVLSAPAGDANAATVVTLHNFSSPDQGYLPRGDLLVDQSGNLYGTTANGGNFENSCRDGGCGTVFELAPDGTETVLYAFAGAPDGSLPLAGLIADQAGNLYGTTASGGGGSVDHCGGLGCGTVFKLAPDGTETVLYAFQGAGGDGFYPAGDLLLDQAGNLYGTTQSGGNVKCGGYGCGTAFELAPDGTETVLHIFKGGTDGAWPGWGIGSAGLIADQSGNLYGVTYAGGGSGCGGYGCGTIFRLAADGTETILHSFRGGHHDGSNPAGSLTMDDAGNLYGTTLEGGSLGPRRCSNDGYTGCGTVFELPSNGKIKILHHFIGRDGAFPVGRIVFDAAGDIFGNTVSGGHGYKRVTGNPVCDNSLAQYMGCGTSFQLAPDGTETVLYPMAPKRGGQVPFGGLAIDQAGNLYGTTISGITCNDYCGTVFKITP